MTSDERGFMQLALDEARRGRTSPNPRVGAVIVERGEVIASGYHAAAGQAHAEVAAIRNAGRPVAGATLYVTLEPCHHHGRTGPCTEAIIEAKIARVVIGCRDPAPHGPGGIERLKRAGIEIELGLLEDQATALVADFAKHVKTGLPFVTLKAAVTLDGKIASRTGESKWITGEAARTETHRMRADADAILVGIGTVLADDPRLTVRHVEGVDPVRVVLDADLRTPPDAAILDPKGESTAPVWIFHAEDALRSHMDALALPEVELIAVPRHPRGVDLGVVLKSLGERDIVRLMVEGGAHVHGSFVEAGLADRAAIFVAPRIMGDAEAISFAAGVVVDSVDGSARLVRTEIRAFGSDWLVTGDFERTA
ncbi:MAG: bifunctional diaminohydroxyphosphoribosylaminopyrimidine deaminase/5-amino-6-(5-phosphoribosylamino)uracil reductase RibD [Myxococcales bacterium]|nr:bifunctional diaminohydroxyphosphoribosylaminopyrimidine deaminase/5-amino-6-(5-phosphoribosylamino)uracil reductase RibD [Myxococcales bacterium]MDH3484478.1 bifunctional diaminohydroxyphosphoribosylaminopyrimidine deaminase/5-amino-6-(5-phosphoribosylamino)uracil reductase RibD [Myxococcales bacterium]